MDNNSVDSKKNGEKVEKSAQEKASDSISSNEEAAVSSESSSTIELSQGVAGANEASKSESSIKEVPVEEKVKKEASGSKEPETEKPEQKQSEKNAHVQKKSSGSGSLVKAILVLLLLLLLAAAGWAGWWFYQLQQQEPVVNTVQQNLESQQQDIKRLEQRLDDERAERQNQQQSQAALNQSISDIQLSINSHARRLRELSTTSRSDWLLAEAEYLIRLANQRLITERNTKNATSLLVTADGILRDLDEVDLLPVRKALAKSITALRSTQMVDREGLYLQLSALSEQLVNLPLMAPELDEEVSVDVETEVTEAKNGSISEEWRERLFQSFNSALESASDLIRVRRRDAPLEPLPSVEEDQQLRHNLAILLEQAQMALLREEQAIYQVSLEKAQAWLNNYFELNESAIPLVEQLALLEQENVVQQLPDISEGLEVLRDYIDSWHKRHTVQQSGEDQAEE